MPQCSSNIFKHWRPVCNFVNYCLSSMPFATGSKDPLQMIIIWAMHEDVNSYLALGMCRDICVFYRKKKKKIFKASSEQSIFTYRCNIHSVWAYDHLLPMQSSILLHVNAAPELRVHIPLLKHFACYSHTHTQKKKVHRNIMKWN